MTDPVKTRILKCSTTDCTTKWNQAPGRNIELAVCEVGCDEACEEKTIGIFRRWISEMMRRKELTKKPRQKV